MKSYYSILEIEDFSSLEAIKKAHRKLSLKYHPDLNKGDKWHEEKFKTIQNAYEHLSTAEKKQEYDAYLTAFYYNENNTYSFTEPTGHPNEHKHSSAPPARKYNYRFPWLFIFFAVSTLIRVMSNDTNNDFSNVVFQDNNHFTVSANAFLDSLAQNDHLTITTNVDDSNSKFPSVNNQLLPRVSSSFFTIGSTTSQVIEAQGSATSMSVTTAAKLIWLYGRSSVVLDNNVVVGYANVDNNLKVSLVPGNALINKNTADGFTIGSRQDYVLALQGTPLAVSKNDFTNEVTWKYGNSSVILKDNVVNAYFNVDNNLKIKP